MWRMEFALKLKVVRPCIQNLRILILGGITTTKSIRYKDGGEGGKGGMRTPTPKILSMKVATHSPLLSHDFLSQYCVVALEMPKLPKGFVHNFAFEYSTPSRWICGFVL